MNSRNPRLSFRSVAAILTVGLPAFGAFAQTPYLVKDFQTGYPERFGIAPERMVADGDSRVFFMGFDRANGLEPWVTDGSATGTRIIRDIRASRESVPADAESSKPVVLNHVMYFSANDGLSGLELWRTDGTVDGTYLVSDTFPGPTGGGAGWLCAVGSDLFFGSARSTSEGGIWKSDGTTVGTHFVKQHSRGVKYLTPCNGLLFYVTGDQLTSDEIWRSDGTAEGTFLLQDIYTGSTSSQPYPLVPFGNVVLFGATSQSAGRELWRTDGTVSGTYLLRDLGGSSSSFLDMLVVAGSQAFFVANDGTGQELWVTDGTEAGTHNVFQSAPGSGDRYIRGLQSFGNLVLFLSDTELWRSDGTAAGTWKVSDASWNEGLQQRTGRKRITYGDLVYFVSNAGGNGLELWRTDGTTAGTLQLGDLWPGPESSAPAFGAGLNGLLLFQAATPTEGTELWSTDGTPEGTELVGDLTDFNGDGAVKNMTDVSGTLFLTAWDSVSSRVGLFKTQGTMATTELVTTVTAGSLDAEINTLTPYNGGVMFYARDDTSQTGLYFSDGTLAGTSRLFTIAPTGGSPTVNGGLFYFGNNGLGLGYELWISDGTATGTGLLKDIRPGPGSSGPGIFGTLGTLTLFFANDGVHGTEVWCTDGSEQGTTLVKDIFPGSAGSLDDQPTIPARFTRLGDALIFAANDGVHGDELWRTDGTEGGTQLIADLRSGVLPSHPAFFTRVGDELYFFCYSGGSGYDLWRTDGTTEGTQMVIDLGSDLTGFRRFASPVEWQGLLYFLLYNETIGTELWRSDGSAEGTYMVTQIWPEVYPQPYVVSFSSVGPLLFPGFSPYSGSELFRSDGSALGTLPVEVVPGPGSSGATAPVASGDVVYFPANEGRTGQELWAVPAEALIFPRCLVDLNGDGLVDFSDYLEFLNLYDASDPRVDFNGDGLVDFSDYLEFLNLYDAGC